MYLLKHLVSDTFGTTGVLCTFHEAIDKIGSSYTKKQHQLQKKTITSICGAQMVLLVLDIIAVFKLIGEKYGFLNLTPAF